MPDEKKLADEILAKAALSAGKDAAKRAALELPKSKRNKYIAFVVVGLLLVLGLVGLVVSFWQYFLVAGLLGVAGLYGYWRLRRRKSNGGEAAAEKAEVAQPEPVEEAEARARARVDAEAARRKRREQEEERAREARAREEARAVAEQEVTDELAAMKARIERDG